LSKQLLPDAVDHDSGRQRIALASDPHRKFQSPARRRVDRFIESAEHLRKSSFDLLRGLVNLATYKQSHITRRGASFLNTHAVTARFPSFIDDGQLCRQLSHFIAQSNSISNRGLRPVTGSGSLTPPIGKLTHLLLKLAPKL
jgi:hypothetical protein